MGNFHRFTFSIPKQIPTGKYLVHIDIIWSDFSMAGYRGPSHNESQLYPNYIQIEVESESKAKLLVG